MHEREARIHSYAPLWGGWQVEKCLYTSDKTSVYMLSRMRCDKRLVCTVKLIEIRPVDIRELPAQFAAAMDELERMELLAPSGRTVMALDDAVYEIRDASGTLSGYDFLIRMERLSCLADLMREGEAISPAEARRIGRDLAEALVFAHARGFVHRDIKPANIYRTAGNSYQLGDFGVSSGGVPGHTMATITGTTAYMAPEVTLGRAYDHRADLYSLGVVLYQLLNYNFLPLTGEFSTFSEREDAIHRRQCGAALPPPPTGDDALKSAVLRALSTDPDMRFASAEEFLAAMSCEEAPAGRRQLNGVPAALAAGLCALGLAASLLVPHALQSLRPEIPNYNPDFSQAGDAIEIYTDTSKFEVIKQSLTWENARVYCESRGGHLATITSRQEETKLLSLLDKAEIDAAWIGANNRNSSKGFEWVTGERFAYAAWGPNEPNNSGGIEYYLMLMRRDGAWTWNDSRDDGLANFPADRVGFICEWDDDDAE